MKECKAGHSYDGVYCGACGDNNLRGLISDNKKELQAKVDKLAAEIELLKKDIIRVQSHNGFPTSACNQDRETGM